MESAVDMRVFEDRPEYPVPTSDPHISRVFQAEIKYNYVPP